MPTSNYPLITALQTTNMFECNKQKFLKKPTEIKEIYIGRYMDQCPDYIAKKRDIAKKTKC
jgi:hypothetical protein